MEIPDFHDAPKIIFGQNPIQVSKPISLLRYKLRKQQIKQSFLQLTWEWSCQNSIMPAKNICPCPFPVLGHLNAVQIYQRPFPIKTLILSTYTNRYYYARVARARQLAPFFPVPRSELNLEPFKAPSIAKQHNLSSVLSAVPQLYKEQCLGLTL